jgi:MoaA/NifB/PqqE/SkfB family radical SAM enzyme
MSSELAKEQMDQLIGSETDSYLDGTKIRWYHNRVRAWENGKRIAPVTIDMALTRTCNYRCTYCYATLQGNNQPQPITKEHMTDFLNDAREIGVKGVSLVSDGESSISPAFEHSITYGHKKGLAMAVGTNAYLVKGRLMKSILPCLTYFRVNITAGEEDRYREIMGVKGGYFKQVCKNIEEMVKFKMDNRLSTTLGLQMVLMPEFEDQIMPLSKLALDLGVDYLQIKHCSDDEFGNLGVDYQQYGRMYDLLREAEALTNSRTKIKVKWSKIREGNKRSYQRCYGPPFLLQISGSGLVAPCGMLFNSRYKRYHIGNITEQRFKDIWASDRYWEVIRELASERFNAQKMCGSLCLQHSVNKYLDNYKKGEFSLRQVEPEIGESEPQHKEFV